MHYTNEIIEKHAHCMQRKAIDKTMQEQETRFDSLLT